MRRGQVGEEPQQLRLGPGELRRFHPLFVVGRIEPLRDQVLLQRLLGGLALGSADQQIRRGRADARIAVVRARHGVSLTIRSHTESPMLREYTHVFLGASSAWKTAQRRETSEA